MQVGDKGTVLKTVSRTRRIRTSLFIAFCIPVILIVALGVGAYYITSNAMVTKYEKSTSSNMTIMTMYLSSICDNVKREMANLIIDANINSYYNKYGEDITLESTAYYNAARDKLIALKASLGYISNYYVFGEIGETITSHDKNLPKSLYKDYQTQKEAEALISGKARNQWIGYHPYLDRIVKGSDDDYAFSYIIKLQKNNGFISVDIDQTYMEEMLNAMAFGEGSIKAIITPDGREIAIKEKQGKDDSIHLERIQGEKNIFVGSSFFEQSLNKSSTGISTIFFEGKPYLYGYSSIGSTGIMVCTLIPKSIIMDDVNQVRNLTIIIIAAAFIIVFIIGICISNGISKDLLRTCGALDSVAGGNLTTKFFTKRRDEFKLLNISINEMLKNIRHLMGDMKEFGFEVSESATGVFEIAGHVSDEMSEVSSVVDKMMSNVIEQAVDMEKCTSRMGEFSDKLNNIHVSTEQMNTAADETIHIINSGQEIVDELNRKTESTVTIARRLIKEIREMQEKTNDIGSIVQYMNEIAENTNLLSLNASIEAARAGEFGKGFAIVAGEIRKLADQSMKSSNQIKQIIENIWDKTVITVESAEEVGEYMEAQTVSLVSANDVFYSINHQVSSLVGELKCVQKSMTDMMNDKEHILETIRSVSQVSGESAVASQTANNTIEQQLILISSLAKDAEKLKGDVCKLEESMNQFIIVRDSNDSN